MGNEEVVVCVEGVLALFWRSPRCASAGMNLQSDRNNDTSNTVTKRGKGGGEMEGRERERERDGME